MTQGDNIVSSSTKKYKEVKYTGEVSNKYGTQKGISSDEFSVGDLDLTNKQRQKLELNYKRLMVHSPFPRLRISVKKKVVLVVVDRIVGQVG